MKNTTFTLKAQRKKGTKLMTVLRQKTHDTLTEDQLFRLIHFVRPGKQYTVTVHTLPDGFCDALVLVSSGGANDVGTVVFGQAKFGEATDIGYCPAELLLPSRQVCAVVSRKRTENGHAQLRNEIHIYIPESLYEKGRVSLNGQEFKEPYCV